MKEYNDYIQATRNYLKRYNQFQATIANLKDDICGMEQELECELSPAAPISKYSDEPGGGKPELNAVESLAEKRLAMRGRIDEARKSIENISRILRKVDRAIDALPREEERLIRGHYIERKSWEQLSEELYLTEKWASEKARRAVKEMSFTIFARAEQQELAFTFFE